jgi:hypothetical protein
VACFGVGERIFIMNLNVRLFQIVLMTCCSVVAHEKLGTHRPIFFGGGFFAQLSGCHVPEHPQVHKCLSFTSLYHYSASVKPSKISIVFTCTTHPLHPRKPDLSSRGEKVTCAIPLAHPVGGRLSSPSLPLSPI